MRRILFPVFLLFTFFFSHAQQFGGNPPSVKWQQINTDTARIIFPKGYDARARRIANIIHTLQRNYSHTIGDTIRKISIVLQNQGLVSNGYVGLAPYRSEFYTTPPQNAFELGAINWTDNLAVHEFRHVQQFSNFNKGGSKLAGFFFGEQGRTVANAIAIPDWFFEGDAVFNETKLTPQGRGTLPLFLGSYQSLFLANRKYSYMKMRNGSLRDYVPDHYNLGYLLVAYGRKKYGDDIWRKVTNDAARFDPLFYPFQGAVKKYTGITYDQFVNDAMNYYQQQWQSALNEKPEWFTQTIARDVVNYQYPYHAEDGSLIVVKSSYRHVPAFYKIHPDKTEERIAVKDISEDAYFSYNNGKIIYAASQPDARWGNLAYHSIKIVDVQSGEETNVVSHTKYFSPDISHDGKNVLTVEIEPSGESRVVVMNTAGDISDTLPKSDIVFSHPKFAADDNHYYVAARNPIGQMSLVKYTLHDNHPGEILVPLSNRIIGFLNVQGDTLLFTTTFQGRDELWVIIDGKDRRGPFRLASFATGLYQGVLQNSGTLIASAFTADGYRLGTFQPLWQRVEIKDDLTDLYINDVFKKEDHLLLSGLTQQQYEVSKYPKSFQMRNTNSSMEESVQRVEAIRELCIRNNKELVVYLSMGFGNPYGDDYNKEILLHWADEMISRGIAILSLADTVGLATPAQISFALQTLVPQYPDTTIGVHLHSTPQNWKSKVDAAVAAGCKRFDGALKGIGGCPMAQDELVGNMDTELMIPYFEEQNLVTGLDKEALQESLRIAAEIFI